MAPTTPLPRHTQTTIIRDLLNNTKEHRAVTPQAVDFFAALDLIHPGAEPSDATACAARSSATGPHHDLWGILRDPDIQGPRLREEFFALGPAFHCAVHATASDYARFAQTCLDVCLRSRSHVGIGIAAAPTPSPAATGAPPTPPASPEDGDAAIVNAAVEEMLLVQQSPTQASTAAWMQALHVADHILKRAGVPVHGRMLPEAVMQLEQGAAFAQLGPLEQSTLLYALGRAKGCFEHGI
ncbi:hypothetical protein Tdes44962_MAKER04171 [Teratosphaeria destructans]|uniref:Uncharacterized protein n=1 Tax=Teratosphaeria destructans TaxID=418781 RepID=A0A9W7SMR5_9PEZI|nr:hypothetical protein Tdes44962_MAKER04171 [Teratosphaeria destructans]